MCSPALSQELIMYQTGIAEGIQLERKRIHDMIINAIKHNWTMNGRMVTLSDIALTLEAERSAGGHTSGAATGLGSQQKRAT